jgi:hypothetical protein
VDECKPLLAGFDASYAAAEERIRREFTEQAAALTQDQDHHDAVQEKFTVGRCQLTL